MKEEEFYGRITGAMAEKMIADSLKKDTNPKDSVGIAKVPMSCVPSQVMMEVGLAMMEGSLKYGRHNYRATGVRSSVYYDAAMRHLMAFWEGEDTDPDSGLPHLVKAMATLAVLRDAFITDNVVDDRPPVTQYKDWVQGLNAKAKSLIQKYPEPKQAYVQKECPNAKVCVAASRPEQPDLPGFGCPKSPEQTSSAGGSIQFVLPTRVVSNHTGTP